MEAICTSRPHCTPITNSTNGQDSLSTGVGRVRLLLNGFLNAAGNKPPRAPGCCPTVGWPSTCACRPVTSKSTWPHRPTRDRYRPHALSKCRFPPPGPQRRRAGSLSLRVPLARVYVYVAPNPPRRWQPWGEPLWRRGAEPTSPAQPHLLGHRTRRLPQGHRCSGRRVPTAPGR
jgi:hypothetical protein